MSKFPYLQACSVKTVVKERIDLLISSLIEKSIYFFGAEFLIKSTFEKSTFGYYVVMEMLLLKYTKYTNAERSKIRQSSI